MTMRVILLVRGSLVKGGSFHGSIPTNTSMSGSGGVVRASAGGAGPVHVPGGQHSSSGLGGRSTDSKRATAGGGIVFSGANKFSQTPTFAINRSTGADADQGEDDELKKAPVVDVADDVDAHVWNITKDAIREDDSQREHE